MKAKTPAPQRAYPPNTYRGKDVTGALSFVRSMMEWDLFPKEKRPKTDREAAALFFEIDRSNASMAEFLAAVKEHCVAELDRLSKAKRKAPKKVRIGTLNVATGEYRSRFPDVLVLPPRVYDDVRARIAWLEAAPKGIEPPEEEFERVTNRVADFLDDTRYPGVYAASVQIETEKTKTKHTNVGALVVLLEDDASIDAGSGEHHCYIQRGKRG